MLSVHLLRPLYMTVFYSVELRFCGLFSGSNTLDYWDLNITSIWLSPYCCCGPNKQTNKTYTDTQTLKKHFLTHTHTDMARDYMPVLNRLPLPIKLWWESPDLSQNFSTTATVVIGKAISWLKFTLGYTAFEKSTRTYTQNKAPQCRQICLFHSHLPVGQCL